MRVTPIHTRILKEGEDLFSFIVEHVGQLNEKTVLVVSSKIIALSEARVVHSWDVEKRDELVRTSADTLLTCVYPQLTYQNGVYTAAAGIDTSNGNGALVLPPRDSWKTARDLKVRLLKKYHLRAIGVLIVDSMPLPGKRGVISQAIACAGFSPVRQYKGKKDIFGRVFQYSSANYADALAAASGVVMGEGAELCPLVLITEAPVDFTARKIFKRDVVIPLAQDIFQPLSRCVEKTLRKTLK